MSAPPLSARVWGVLLENEWFKMRKRLAFWMTLGFYCFITFMVNAESAFDDDSTFALPEAWDSIFSDSSTVFVIFASIALIMLASSEFSWRTARQNVIDGLSKKQWFWGKAMLLPLLGFVFLSAKLALSIGLALPDTIGAEASGPIFPGSVLAACAGLFLVFLNVGGLALLLSTAIRSAGPAMAAWFFWIGFGEQLFPAILTRFLPSMEAAFRYFPFASAGPLTQFAMYDDAAFQRLSERAEQAERAVPELPGMLFTVSVNLGWAVFFISLAYLLFRRRDL